MSILKVGFGLVLAYPIHVLLIPLWVDSANGRYGAMLGYINPTLAETVGISLVPNMLFVVACVGLGLIAACVIYQVIRALFDGIYIYVVGRFFSNLHFISSKPRFRFISAKFAPIRETVTDTAKASSVRAS